MALASFILAGTIDVTLHERGFSSSLALFGIGAGLLMSQMGNVIISSAPVEETNEAGGLQGTAQNLGASLGTALIGSVERIRDRLAAWRESGATTLLVSTRDAKTLRGVAEAAA